MGLWDLFKQLARLVVAAWWAKVTENYSPRPETHKYTTEYPKEYSSDYFQNGFSNYSFTPDPANLENNLYDNRFKYRKQKNKYAV